MTVRAELVGGLGALLVFSCAPAQEPAAPPVTAVDSPVPGQAQHGEAPTAAEATEPAAAPVSKPPDWSAAGPKLADAPGIRECPRSLGGRENVDRVITKECGVVPVTKEYRVDGATLTLGPGASLAFQDGASLYVGRDQPAKLMVLGTDQEAVTFTSSGDKQPGVWKGVFLGAKASRSYLGGLVLEYAGGKWGALSVMAEDVSVLGLTVRHAKELAVSVTRAGSFKAFSYNVLTDAEIVPLEVSSTVAGQLGPHNSFAANGRIRVVRGTISGDVTWQAPGAPYLLLGKVKVQGERGEAAKLTLSPGTEVEFDADASLVVGAYGAAELVVAGTEKARVRLGSGKEKKPGAWSGVHIGNKGVGTVAYALFEHGGGRDGKVGALSAAPGASLSVKRSSFVGNSSGVHLGRDTKLAKFDENEFKATPVALKLYPELLGALGAKNSYHGSPKILVSGGRIKTDATWRLQRGARIELNGNLDINGADVKVEAGYALFVDNAGIDVGRYQNASLSLLGTAQAPVTIAGIRDEAGSWRSLGYHNKARGNVLTHVRIQGSGRKEGAVHFVRAAEGKVDTLSCAKCAGGALDVVEGAKVEVKNVTPG